MKAQDETEEEEVIPAVIPASQAASSSGPPVVAPQETGSKSSAAAASQVGEEEENHSKAAASTEAVGQANMAQDDGEDGEITSSSEASPTEQRESDIIRPEAAPVSANGEDDDRGKKASASEAAEHTKKTPGETDEEELIRLLGD